MHYFQYFSRLGLRRNYLETKQAKQKWHGLKMMEFVVT
jgi:hypothetical protein